MTELIDETVDLDGFTLAIRRPPNAEALLDEEAFEREEFLPYWAELWPSGIALARELVLRDVAALLVVELGCGLAVPSLAAALGGARTLATDWAPDAIALVEANAARNGIVVDVLRCSWAEPEPLIARGPFDLVLAADVLYERRNVDQLLALLPRLVATGEVLLADPGRPHLRTFLETAQRAWRIEATARPEPPAANVTIYSLRRR